MKTLTTSLLAGALAAITGAGTALAADEKPERKPGRGDGSFIQKMDKNGDRSISKEEAGERWDRLGKLDEDGDDKVSMQELMAARPGGPKGRPDGPKGRPDPSAFFDRADKNGDGKIAKDEVPEQAWGRLGRLDKDEDNAVSKEEMKAGRPGPGGPGGPGGRPGGGEFMKRADKNGDGSISKDELPERAWERFGKLDKDGDDVVTREEMAAGFAAMRRGGDKGKGKGKGRPGAGPGALFSRYDENDDGKIAEDEVPAEMWSKLRKADTDADGLVSQDELGKVYQRGGGNRPDSRRKRPELEKEEKKDDAV